mmetsp:Transcript_4964/g.7474  ORF Transcript_4964/g.7474 Transcript_4964/m.7474 type:complete len:128 (+) Transcript_4964:1094-1477(+)
MTAAKKVARNPKFKPQELSPKLHEVLKKKLVKSEFDLLEALGYQLEAPLPYQYIKQTWQGLSSDTVLLRVAHNFANDSFRSRVVIQASPEDIGNACLHLAMLFLNQESNLEPDPRIVSSVLSLYKVN